MPRNAAAPAARMSLAVSAASRRPEIPAAPIRRSTDEAAGAVATFVAGHPEYARLGVEVVEQVMATYRTPEEHDTLAKLRDEGVPVGRRERWSDEA